jgi:hypothetical protein
VDRQERIRAIQVAVGASQICTILLFHRAPVRLGYGVRKCLSGRFALRSVVAALKHCHTGLLPFT